MTLCLQVGSHDHHVYALSLQARACMGSFDCGGPVRCCGARIASSCRDLLHRVADDISEVCKVENMPKMEGRQMIMMIGPLK